MIVPVSSPKQHQHKNMQHSVPVTIIEKYLNMTKYFGGISNVKLTGNEPFCMLHMAQHNFDSKISFLNFLPSQFESQKSLKL